LNKLKELKWDKNYSIIREYCVFPYFIDFAFINEMVAVEIDGSQHLLPDRSENDKKKDDLLNSLGWSVVRISEKEVKTDIQNTFKKITHILENKTKVNNYKIGLVVKPKKRQKKERNEHGFTEDQVKSCIRQRKVNLPPFTELLKLIETYGYSGTGRIFNVSDNTIRKWVKSNKKGLY
jgi:very-short-patch-repair endonuclease